MDEHKRVMYLLLIMMIIGPIIGGISILLLYQTALEEQRAQLVETARSQARLLEAVARFDAEESQDYPGGATEATLSQIRDAHENYYGFGETGEFTLARHEDDMIVFLLSHRHYDLDVPKPVPMNSAWAEPMRQALSGQSGTVVGLDYRGKTVLAAYEPVAELDLGIVAKIDLSEIRAPFVRASAIAGLSAISIILLGTKVFLQISNPMLRQLAESEARFREIFEKSPLGMVLVNPELRFEHVNPRFCDMLGYSAAELINITSADITYSKDIRVGEKETNQLLNREISFFDVNKRYTRKDGEHFWAHTTVAIIRADNGEPLYLLAMVEDITERVRAEEEMRQAKEAAEAANIAKTEFLQRMTHELRTPLNAVIGFAGMLKRPRTGDLNEKQTRYVDNIHTSGEGLLAQVNDVLDLTALETGEVELSLQPVLVSDLFNRLGNQLAEKAQNKGVHLMMDSSDPELKIWGDNARLGQILFELLDNAVKFTPEGGQVSAHCVALTPAGDGEKLGFLEQFVLEKYPLDTDNWLVNSGNCILITVADTGIGIKAEDHPKIFAQFEQVEDPLDRQQEGSGLGLALTKSLVELHGGRIWFESDGLPGEGTTFYVALPQNLKKSMPDELKQ